MAKNPVLKYSQFINEKMNQNLAKLDMGKGSKITKEVDPNMEEQVPKSGKKMSKEVKPTLETLPKGGKMSSKEVTPGLAKVSTIKGKSAGTKTADSNLAKLPGKKK